MAEIGVKARFSDRGEFLLGIMNAVWSPDMWEGDVSLIRLLLKSLYQRDAHVCREIAHRIWKGKTLEDQICIEKEGKISFAFDVEVEDAGSLTIEVDYFSEEDESIDYSVEWELIGPAFLNGSPTIQAFREALKSMNFEGYPEMIIFKE